MEPGLRIAHSGFSDHELKEVVDELYVDDAVTSWRDARYVVKRI
ncbi:MAG: hypothetical protein ACLS43_08955 [Evtepia gabavorous]